MQPVRWVGTLSFPGQGPLKVEDIHSKPQRVSKQSFSHSKKNVYEACERSHSTAGVRYRYIL